MRIALIFLFAIALLSAFAPTFAPDDPAMTDPEIALQPPSATHWFGTDLLGRDVFSRVLYGGRRTLIIAGAATIFAVLVGGLLGAVAGLWHKTLDRFVRVLLDALLAIPGLVLALAIITWAGRGDLQLALAVGVAQVARFGLITRAGIITVRTAGYVAAAESIGAGRWHILRYHMLPNVRGTLVTYAGVLFSYAIINIGALGFLGLTGDSGNPDLGLILAEGRFVLRTAPWVSIASGLTIVFTVLSINTLIDTLSR